MESPEIINRIEAKIRSIKMRLNSLQEDNQLLLERVQDLTQALKDKESLIAKYEQNQYIENIIKNNNGSDKAKQIIDDMLREIDKCIVLLNK